MTTLDPSMPKVLHLDHSTEFGGAEIGLARILGVQDSWSATIALPPLVDGKSGPFDSVPGTRLRMISCGPVQRSGASKADFLAALRFIISIISTSIALRLSKDFRSADVIHANTSRSAVYGALACSLSTKPLVIHLRDAVTSETMGKLGWAAFTKIALRRATSVISNSEWTLQSAKPFLKPKCHQVVIPSASGITPIALARVRPRVARIGMVARIDPWKGQLLLLEAFAGICGEFDIELYFAGSAQFGHTEYLSDLKNYVSIKGLQDIVHFSGQIDDVPEFIESMDICLQTSLRPEPLGQNILQYLASGKPVIASAAGGPVEWIESGRNGLLFEPGNAKSLQAALRELIIDTEFRKKLAQAACTTPGLMTDLAVAAAHGRVFANETC